MNGYTYFALQLGRGILIDSRMKRETLLVGTNIENKELGALISLMDEPNEEIYGAIKQRIFGYGTLAVPLLESAWENSFDPVIQHRIEDLVHHIQLDDLKHGLKEWSQFYSNDLLRGYMLVSRYQYPDMKQEEVIKTIGQISQDVWLEINSNLTGLEKVKVINHILFDIHKFSGNVSGSKSPDSHYITNLLETHKGSSLSVGILYIIISQSLKIPVYGVDLPRHFVLAYMNAFTPDKSELSTNDVLFYLNPFNKGAVFTRNEIELFIKQLSLEKKPEYFKPCDNRIIIRRLINELIYMYDQSGNKRKSAELKELLDVIE